MLGKTKISDGEMKVMEYIWDREPVRAVEIIRLAKEEHGWSKNTTYTLLSRLTEKEAICREEPGFICRSLISRAQVRREETRSLIDKVYQGSRKLFLTSFLSQEKLTAEEIDEIQKMIDRHQK